MNYDGMTHEELVQEAIKAILSLTDEQCERLMEEFLKEYPEGWGGQKR